MSATSTAATTAPATATATAAVATATTTGETKAAPAAAATAKRIVLVTGANKGIGLAIVDSLSRDEKLTVLLGARNITAGNEAVRTLANVKAITIDVNDTKSVIAASEEVKKEYGGLDILINNAGIVWKGDTFNEEVVTTTFNTNYYGVKRVYEAFSPLLRENGRVVNLSSIVGRRTFNKLKPEVAAAFFAADATTASVEALLTKFATDVKENKYAEEGWPKTAYGMSKVGCSAYTRIIARENRIPGVVISACCPGYVMTDMNDHGVKTPAQGAETPVFCALLPHGAATGLFYEDSAPASYS